MIAPLPGDIFRAGQVLNNTYEIEGVLGRGGTGEVYRARNLISGRVVAIKALNAQFSGQEGYIALMRREEQMRDIRDDAVVRYTECSRSDQGHVFLVMDYIDGPSMADVMMRRRMEPRELMIIAHRVAEGLVAAHSHGIVHRDLSPDNVILAGGSPEKATIIDFGIAKDTGAGARTIVGNDFAGKYEYAAPEQMEGKAEARSDLYALGALLLASWKGQVPFAGMTPGEMIRRKGQPLDTLGVPEPLKGLIDWLSAPQLSQRAPSAQAVVDQVGIALGGSPGGRAPEVAATRSGTRAHPRTPAARELGMVPKKRSSGAGFLVLVLLVMLGAGGGGAFYLGLFDEFLKPELPVVSPYTLSAEAAVGPSPATLTANAPDESGAASLRSAFAALAGAEAAPEAVTLAQGVPGPGWVPAVASLFPLVAGLEDWSIEVSDLAATVTGLAPDAAQGKAIREGLEGWAKANGFTLTATLTIGPRILTLETVQAVIDSRATCGRLSLLDPPAGGYPLGATIGITGSAPDGDLAADLQLALRDIIGDRKLRVDLTPLNPDVCAVRQVLPDVPSDAITIRLSDAATGETNLTGVFHQGQQVLVDVLIPEGVQGKLWVVAVDNTHQVFNLLPNAQSSETEISRLGTVAGGTRQVRVVFTQEDVAARRGYAAITVQPENFGKSEFLAFVAKEDLFGTRGPKDESVASFAEGLAESQAAKPGNITAFASRLLDARP